MAQLVINLKLRILPSSFAHTDLVKRVPPQIRHVPAPHTLQRIVEAEMVRPDYYMLPTSNKP
jgi:hypothetical protein